MDIAMKCKTIMEQNRLESEELEQKVLETAKLTINYLTKHKIPLTPINYDEWFYVMCKALEEQHIISEKNLRILYKKYIENFQSEEETKRRQARQISQELENVTKDSQEILSAFDTNIVQHSQILDESVSAIDKQDLQKISSLKSKIEELELENKKLKQYLDTNRAKLESIEAKFNKTKEEAQLDALTQVYNRKKFDHDLQMLDSEGIGYSMIFLDIDDFKKINDTFGHTIGDKVLKEVGEILRHYLRRNTFAYRYGGEEFVVVLPGGDINAAKVVAERLREVIEHRAIKIDDHRMINFTASFGAAQKEEGEAAINVLKRADEALYEAKRSGKNRVVTR